MANERRYKQFRDELAALVREVSPVEQIRMFEARVLNLLARADLRPSELSRLKRQVEDLFGDTIAPWKDRLFEKYSEILDVVNTLYDDLPVDVTRDMARIRTIEMANAAELGDYDEAVARAVQRAVREGITEGDRVRELERRIAEVGGKAEVYARTLAQTQIKTVARGAKAEKARVAGVQYYEYVGIERDTTRAFCRHLIGETLHVDTIHQLRNGNREPVLLYCGGWNCIHDWEPDPFATAPTLDDIAQAQPLF